MEILFAGIRTHLKENPTLFYALDVAADKLGDCKNRIYEEGEYANWETLEQMDEVLADYAQDVAVVYENHVRGECPEDVNELLKHVDTIYYYAKEELEKEVPAEHKAAITK